MHFNTVLLGFALSLAQNVVPSAAKAQAEAQVVIPPTSFNSQTDFDTYWNYLYPWGTDHNGAARMDKEHVKIENGTVTLTAQRVRGQRSAEHGGRRIDIHYLSGAIHAKEHVNISVGGGYDFAAELKATTARGTWPAAWLSGIVWPPEVDMAEWKGSGKISFNTFNTSSQVAALDVAYPSPSEFHKFKCEVRDVNGRDVSVKFYMDEKLVTTQVGRNFVGKPMYLCVNICFPLFGP